MYVRGIACSLGAIAGGGVRGWRYKPRLSPSLSSSNTKPPACYIAPVPSLLGLSVSFSLSCLLLRLPRTAIYPLT